MVTKKMSPLKLINNVFSGIVTLFLLINLFAVHAAPPGACSDGCSGSNQLSKYKFVSGNIYNYNVDNTITVQLAGNDAQETTLKLQGTAQLYAQGNCNYILKLPRMQVIGADGKKFNLGTEIIKPVRFQMTNDEIGKDICTETDDTEFSVNIKRSIISLLQTGNTKSYETDIFGVCPTEFTLENQESNTVAVGKRRNLNMCSQRESIYNGIIQGIVNKNSDIKTTPLLKGDYTSATRIKNGIIDVVQLAEEYHYIPLSSANGGIRVKTLTKLTFASSAAFTTQFPKFKKETQRSIIFTKPESTPQGNSQHVRNVFKATLQSFENGISNKAASKFIELTRVMRFTKKEDFIQMYQQLKSGTLGENRVLARKIYLDALFRVGTGASVEACLTFLKNREFSDVEQKLLFLSFNMVKTMTKEGISLITRYIDEGTLTTEAYLSFGHLIYKYCKQYSCESNEIKPIYEKFSNKLGGCKTGTRTQEDTNVAILKGLRNTKYLFSPALEKVIQCTTDKVSTRLRVAALQALTAGACNLKAQNAALNIMKNRNEDSEVRIEAYLLLANCPNGNIANELKNMLDTETVYQVGSYIVSHLANLRASTDSSKDAARYHFGQIRTSNKFPNDFRRYSFNREFSYDVRSIGAGASMESDVIYSQKSFMPRSARLNMTGEVFGTSFNFFELEGRQENLDMVMEHYFGPKGLFKTSSPQELFDKFKESYKGMKEQTRQSIYGRKKRGIREDANVFAKSVTLGNDVNSDLDMDLSVKLFGNEMFFLSLGQNMPNSPKEFLDKFLECIRNSINEAKNFHNTFEKHVIFLDAEVVYPTGAGLPLKLNAQGTGIFRLDSSSKIDIVKILKEPKNTNFEVKFEPSFNVEVSGTLAVDGYGVSTGLFVVGSLHSSTAAQVNFAMLDDGKGVDVSLQLPKSKQELFSFDHRIVFVTQDRGSESIETPLKFSSKKKEFNECFDQLFHFIGVTFCADVSITVPSGATAVPFPLNGNNKFIVWLEVEPEYKFQALVDDKSRHHKSLTLSFDTPNAKFDRKSSLKLEAASEPNLLLRATLESPIRNAGVEAGVTNSANEMSLYVKANNAAEEYLAKIGFAKSGAPPLEQFRPIIIFNTPKNRDNNIMGYTVDGVITREPFGEGKKFNFKNVKITGASMEPFIINGFLTRVNSHIETDLKIAKAGQNGNIKGNFNLMADDLLFDFSMTSNFHKHANGRLKFEFKKNPHCMENNILIVYGDDLNSNENRFELTRKIHFEKSPENRLTVLTFENKLTVPVININLRLNGALEPKVINGDFELIFGKAKNTVMAKVNGKRNIDSDLDYDIESSAGYNDNKIFLNVRRVNKDEKIFLTNKLWTNKGITITLNGDLNEKLTRDNINLNMNSNIILPDNKQELKYSGEMSLLVTPKQITSNGKMLNGAIEFITFNVNINSDGNNRNAKNELIIKDILNAKHDFKMVNGVGEANLIIFLKKINRKIKVQNRFTLKKPDYDMNIDLYYDYDNDQTKMINYNTKTKITPNLINTKNNLQFLNEKYSLNMNYEKSGQLNDGKLIYDIDINLPNEYKIYLNINSNLKHNINDKLTNGESNINFGINNNNNIKNSFKLNTIYNNININNNLYDINNIIEYNNDINNNLLIKFNINNINEINFLFNINGNMINNKNFIINGRKYYDNDKFNQYNGNIEIDKLFKFIINGNYNLNQNQNNNDILLFNINTKYITDKFTKELYINNQFKKKSYGIIDDGKFQLKLNINNMINNKNNKNIEFTTNYNINKEKLFIDFNLLINKYKSINGIIKFNNNNINNNENLSKLNDNNDLNNNLFMKIDCDGIYELNAILKTSELRKIINYNIVFNTPIQGFRNVDLTFNFNRELINEYKTTIIFLCDDNNKYELINLIKISRNNPLFSIDYTYPNGKPIKILFKHNNDNNNGKKFNGKLFIENLREFNMNINYDINISNLDNLLIKIEADSTKLKWDRIIFELHTKPGTNGKGIEFKGQTGGNNVLSGYADYTIKEENGKTIIEGQGNIKLHDKEKAASFKFIRNTFEQARDGETGVLFVLNGLIGQKNILGELKLTDKNFFIKNTICEEKKQCINIEVQSTLQRDIINNYLKHELQISIDLREFGYAHEFGLKAATTQNGFVIDHTVDIHFYTKDKKKYQYSLYIHPEKFGIIIQLPVRIISIEGLYNYPKSQLYGIYDTSITMYLDKKNKPNNKYKISLKSNINKNNNHEFIIDIELKLIHPTIKPYIIDIKNKLNLLNYKFNGQIEMDIFNDINKKLITNYEYDNNIKNNLSYKTKINVYSKGLNINWQLDTNADLSYERKEIIYHINFIPYNKLPSTLHITMNVNKIELLIKLLNDDLIMINGNYDINKHNSNAKGQMKLFGSQPFIVEGSTKGFNSITFKMNKDKLLNVNGQLIAGKEGIFKILSNNKEVFMGRIQFDQNNFLASEYKIQDADFKELVKTLQDTIKNDVETSNNILKGKFDDLYKSLENQMKLIRTSFDDLTGIKNDLKTEMEAIKTELMNDPTIKEYVDFIVRIQTLVIETINQMYKIIYETYKKTIDIFTQTFDTYIQFYNDKIVPMFRKLLMNIEETIKNLYNTILNITVELLDKIVRFLKTFEEDYNKMNKILVEQLKQVMQRIGKLCEAARKEINDLTKLIIDYIKTMPGIDLLKEKYQDFMKNTNIRESIQMILIEVANSIKDTLPTTELTDFVTNLTNYLDKKLSNEENINDIEEITKLFYNFINAIKSVCDLVRKTYQTDEYGSNFFMQHANYFQQHQASHPLLLPFSRLFAINHFPLLTNIRISILNYIRNEPFITLRDLLNVYRPYGFRPFNFLPPYTMHGQISDGSHIFTFDNYHYTFPGGCSYILAQDNFNNNFTIVANMNNGKLKSITLIDKGDIIEISGQGAAQLNGKPADLPIHKNDIHCWRQYYSITLLTTYGAMIQCSPDLRVCHFSVSGYYLGRLRGLLGNGNSEPYDDLLLPNNKVADNFAIFGNAYRLSKGDCKPVPFVDHSSHNHHSEVCSSLFNTDSSLRFCYLFVSPKNYREACDHAVDTATDKQDAACNIALTYASTCHLDNIPVNLPEQCLKCKRNDKTLEIGEKSDVVTPNKQADIIFVVDIGLDSVYIDMLQATINEMRKELKARDINDVKIIIIGYNKEHKYSYLLTTNGNLDFTGKLSSIKYNGPQIPKPIETENDQINDILEKAYKIREKIKEDLSLSADAKAFQQAMDYPFRATASRSIIAVRADRLKHSKNPAKSIGAAIANNRAKRMGISLHMISPIDDLTSAGQEIKTFVGFNSNMIITSDSKRKGNTPDMRTSLKYKSDLGIELVHAANGYVFSLEHYKELKTPKEKKTFTTIMTNALADHIARNEITMECVCMIKRGIFTEEKCIAKETKLLPVMQKKTPARG